MPSLIPGYEYDIFISYRQKDNKYDGWVTEFVGNLKRELESMFKDEVSVYFDINPSDYLLESHDVDASLKDKLKCLIFVPIISRTYCDPKAFAWENELKAFVNLASADQFGFKVKLSGGNVANRVLPIRIHDLDSADTRLFESVVGGVMRSIDFIYRESGVNRQLRAKDDDLSKSQGQILYRDQINKVSLAIREIIESMKSPCSPEQIAQTVIKAGEIEGTESMEEKHNVKFRKVSLLKLGTVIPGILGLVALLITVILLLNRPERKNITKDTLIGRWEIISAVCDTVVNDKVIGDTTITYIPGSIILEFTNDTIGYVSSQNSNSKYSKDQFIWSLTGNDSIIIKFPAQAPLYQKYTVKETILTWHVMTYFEKDYPNRGDTYRIIWFYTSKKLK